MRNGGVEAARQLTDHPEATADSGLLRSQRLRAAGVALDEAVGDARLDPRDAARSYRALEILSALDLDDASCTACLLASVFDGSDRASESARRHWGEEVAGLLTALHRLRRFDGRTASAVEEETPAQVETLRRMLLALAEDIRVVIIQLALHVARLEEMARSQRDGDVADGSDARALGHETLRVQAPLASRLGIWQLKWAMEDLAFRMTEPESYRAIASQLDETRQSRESFIGETIQQLAEDLHTAGIHDADIAGRPKHLFSIRNKMRSKNLKFAQLMDLRAFRILVATEAQCYAVLGILHDRWRPMDAEFDDYITRPKPNGYQSLHTVLLDREERPFEVQIRTHDMHRRAEYGVAAHWKYKEVGSNQPAQGDDAARIAWLRQMLEWGRGPAGEVRLSDDRVYALTPKARIVELPRGATPLDFAYHIHTELGHRCRGAKVNGQIVALTTPLQTGQTVELMTVRQGAPSRDWMNPEAGFLKSTRALQKVRSWFHALDTALARAEDRPDERSAERSTDATVGEGAGRRSELVSEDMLVSRMTRPKPEGSGRVLVVGVDRMLTALARCCKPAPPDDIRGFVTRGRGVSVHRAGCATFARMAAQASERVIDTQWGSTAPGTDTRYLVDVIVSARPRQELLRDVAEVLAREKIPLARMDSFPRQDVLTLSLTLQVQDGEQLRRALAMLRDVAGVVSAQRH